jgi:hypothetical protein
MKLAAAAIAFLLIAGQEKDKKIVIKLRPHQGDRFTTTASRSMSWKIAYG